MRLILCLLGPLHLSLPHVLPLLLCAMAKIKRPKGRLGTLNKLVTMKRARVEATKPELVVPFDPVWDKAGGEHSRCPVAEGTDRGAEEKTSASTTPDTARVKFPVTVEDAEDEDDADEDDTEWEDEDEGVPPLNPYAVRGESCFMTVN